MKESTKEKLSMKKNLNKLFATVLTGFIPMAYADVTDPTLWITDDQTRMVYEVSLDGKELLSSFVPTVTFSVNNVQRITPSSIALDPTDDTLWVVQEGRRLFNYNKLGTELLRIDEDIFSALSPEGMAVDYFDGTLWVVDDPASANDPDTIFHLERDGTVISSFPTSVIDDFPPDSMQAIAADPFNGTLWITDNTKDRIYNIEKDGSLITSFPTSNYDVNALNPQGIEIDESNGTLWVTDRKDGEAGKIYNITRKGNLLSSFLSTEYDPISTDPTGVAYDRDAPRRLKIKARNELIALLPTGDKKTYKSIKKAIVSIQWSLRRNFWESKLILDPVNGKMVFEGSKRAAKELRKLLKNRINVKSVIYALVESDRQLAKFALDTAVIKGGNAKEIDKARKEMAKAADELRKGKFDNAIDKYKKAWEHAIKAL